ncbi:hypothetical protein D0Z03_002914 [Geotrichum reessii]|nr:hypothetical protein D0Z03_002914 [Galactomyces reessii]
MSSTNFLAKVKSVVSGDTIALDTGKTISLAYVSAPRLSSNEAYGFESREHLRTLLVGKQVRINVYYSINNRDYGDLDAPVFTSLIEKSLQEGNVKLRDDANSKNALPGIIEKFTAAEEEAKAKEIGIWASSLSTINVQSEVPENLFGSSKTYNSVVERVIAGDRIQLRVILNKEHHILTNALIAGIKTPRSASPDSPAEPFGDAAKNFTETRLLQRGVTARFIATAANGLPLVEVIHPVGNIAIFLLQAGLASVADWQSQQLGAPSMSALRVAEKKAKDAHLYLWKDLVNTASEVSGKTYEAVISRIISSDTFVLRNNSDKEETVQLTSVRAPRKNDISGSAYAPIAKEFARKRFIGKKVEVKVDAIRPASAQFEERPLVTLTTQGKNISEVLIASGYATVIRHRKDDNDRSPYWDELLEKENNAIAGHKGMHSKKAPPPDRTVDASESASKAKSFVSSLERQGTINGVVDHIISGGRLRIHSERDNLILTLVLSGVRVPRPQEPFGDEALEFVSKRLYQRDVQFSVVGLDKTGGFIGNITIPHTKDTLSVILVKEGLAEVHEYSAQQSGFAQALFDAQEEAQKAKKGLWKNKSVSVPVPVQPVVAATVSTEAGKKNYIDIIVTDISSTGEISFRSQSANAQFTKLSADLNSFNLAGANNSQFSFVKPPRKNDHVTVFPRKGIFRRGKVIDFEKTSNKYTVQEIDTGKIVRVSVSALRPLPNQFSTISTPPLAKAAELSFVQTPPSYPMDHLTEFTEFLRELIEGQQVVANIDSPAGITPLSVTLFTASSKGADDSVNSELIKEGYAFVKSPKSLSAWEKLDGWKHTIAALREFEEDAKFDRIGVWEYGDPREDEN